jgi:predicted RNA-binding Zn-ribbon protein involved in translation (DUF1610 family)
MIKLNFKCPKCDDINLNEVATSVETTTPIYGFNITISEIDLERGGVSIDEESDMQNLVYHCEHCGFQLTNPDGSDVSSAAQLHEWIQKPFVPEKLHSGESDIFPSSAELLQDISLAQEEAFEEELPVGKIAIDRAVLDNLITSLKNILLDSWKEETLKVAKCEDDHAGLLLAKSSWRSMKAAEYAKQAEAEFFIVSRVSRADVNNQGFDTSEIDNSTMDELARKMGDAHTDNSYWQDLDIIAQQLDIPTAKPEK